MPTTSEIECGRAGNQPTIADLAYISGLFDGEGCVSVRKALSARCARGYFHRLEAQVTNQELDVLVWLQGLFKGTIQMTHDPMLYRVNRPIYAWRVVADQAEAFLQAIAPFAKIKRQQILVAITFQTLRHKKHTRVSQFAWEFAESASKRLVELKGRGD